jgi:protein SCO1/2
MGLGRSQFVLHGSPPREPWRSDIARSRTYAAKNTMKRSGIWSFAVMVLAVLLVPAAASAHPQRVSGLILSVLGDQHKVVVRCDATNGKPEETKLFALSRRVSIEAVHAGDHIVGLVDDDRQPVVLDEVQTIPEGPAPNAVHVVVPLSIHDKIPPTEFVDQRGKKFSIDDFAGKSVVLSFIYTRCKDVAECPLLSSHFAVLQKDFANGPFHLVEITLDPTYDTPAVLAKYAKRYGADPSRWSFGTGDAQTVLDFDRRFGLDPFADPRVGLIHTERTVLIDPKGYILDFIDLAGWNPDDIVARLRPSNHPANLIDRFDFYLSRATVAICGNDATGFNGIEDLAIILGILGGIAFVLSRVARFIFRKEPAARS